MKYSKLNYSKVRKLLPVRDINAHKGDMGKLLLICGSRGYTGAAALSALAALRSGAGLVYLGVPESIYEIEATRLYEPVVFPLPDYNGMLSQDSVKTVSSYYSKVDVVLIGPGLGISENTEQVVLHVLKNFTGPVVLDADGITLIKSHKNVLRDRKGPTILTPHEGEFCRFTEEIIEDRQKSAEKLAEALGCIVVLKGHGTVITDGISGFVNKTGNPGMAVGGCGDVLAGMITALIGQGIPPLDAAACGVWLHGKAGDICAKRLGQYGMLPTDMIEILPRLMR